MPDRRAEPRYPYLVPVHVLWGDDVPASPAGLTDLSRHGAAIELDGDVRSKHFLVQLPERVVEDALPMEAVEVEKTWYGTIVHARFADQLSTAQAERLDWVVDALDSHQAESLHRLMTGS